MLSMIGKRLMFAIPSLIGVVIVTFLLTRALPGDRAAARRARRYPPGVVDRPSLPGHDHGRRLAAGVLHRSGAGLHFLIPARLVAGTAWPAGCVLQCAADGDRLLSDRHADRARFRG